MFSWYPLSLQSPTVFPPDLPWGSLNSEWRDVIEAPTLDSLCIISGYGSLHPLPSAADGSLSNDDLTRYYL